FYRRRFCGGGDGRIGGGFTNNSAGLVGADFTVPIACSWGIDCGFKYLISSNNTSGNELSKESWNVGMNLVWYPGSTAKCCCSEFRPLLGVADNGSLLVTRGGITAN